MEKVGVLLTWNPNALPLARVADCWTLLEYDVAAKRRDLLPELAQERRVSSVCCYTTGFVRKRSRNEEGGVKEKRVIGFFVCDRVHDRFQFPYAKMAMTISWVIFTPLIS